jgi:hypothetical protein
MEEATFAEKVKERIQAGVPSVIYRGSARQIDFQQSVIEELYFVGNRTEENTSEILWKDSAREKRLRSCSLAFGSPPRFRLTAWSGLQYIPNTPNVDRLRSRRASVKDNFRGNLSTACRLERFFFKPRFPLEPNMHESKPNRVKPFHLIAKEIVETKKRTLNLSPKAVAAHLGVSHLTFLRWLESDKYHMHAEKLSRLCRILDDFTLLDVLEEEAGRIAFVVPDIKEPLPADEVVAVQRLVKEVGGVLQCLAETLEDHIVEDWEVAKTVPALKNVIRECARLQHWLEKRCLADQKKTNQSI